MNNLNQFVPGGSDEALLKSLTENPMVNQEELVKAMNKAGLVQVQRTINGKNGMYTRMQWVRSSDVKKTDKVVGKQSGGGDRKEPPESPKTYENLSFTAIDDMVSAAGKSDITSDEDGVRVGNDYYWANHDWEEGEPAYFKDSYANASKGEEGEDVESHPVSFKKLAVAIEAHKSGKQSGEETLKEEEEKKEPAKGKGEALQSYNINGTLVDVPKPLHDALSNVERNLRANHGKPQYGSLEEFAKDFNPLAEELVSGEHIKMDNDDTYDHFQDLCIKMFEYGDETWPGKVYETGVETSKEGKDTTGNEKETQDKSDKTQSDAQGYIDNAKELLDKKHLG